MGCSEGGGGGRLGYDGVTCICVCSASGSPSVAPPAQDDPRLISGHTLCTSKFICLVFIRFCLEKAQMTCAIILAVSAADYPPVVRPSVARAGPHRSQPRLPPRPVPFAPHPTRTDPDLELVQEAQLNEVSCTTILPSDLFRCMYNHHNQIWITRAA